MRSESKSDNCQWQTTGLADEVASVIFPSSVSRLRKMREPPSPKGRLFVPIADRKTTEPKIGSVIFMRFQA